MALIVTFVPQFCLLSSFVVVTCRRHTPPAVIVIFIVYRSCSSFIVHRRHAPPTCFAVTHCHHRFLLLLGLRLLFVLVRLMRFVCASHIRSELSVFPRLCRKPCARARDTVSFHSLLGQGPLLLVVGLRLPMAT